MKVFVESSNKLPVVSIAIGFRAGSTFDPPGLEGLTRTTARMLRRGCEGFDAEAIEDRIDALGAEFGADAAPAAVTVSAEVITRNLAPLSDLLSRLLGAPTFPEDELGRLVREAQAELVEARDSDRTLAGRAFRRTLFAGHPYGRRVAGLTETLARIDAAAVRKHYQAHYTRADAVVAISGDISEKGGRELAEAVLARLPAGPAPADGVPEPSPTKGRRLVIVDKPERTQTQMVVGWLGTRADDADHWPWLVGNTAFGGTFTSKLMQEIRAKRGWSYGASSRIGFDRHRDAFTMWTAPSEKDAPACLALELELLAELRDKGLTAEEVEFTKSYLVRSHAFEVDTPRKRVHQPLEEALFDLPAGYHARFVERVRGTSLDEVNAALKARTPVDDLVIGVVATEKSSGDRLREAVPRLGETIVLPFDFE